MHYPVQPSYLPWETWVSLFFSFCTKILGLNLLSDLYTVTQVVQGQGLNPGPSVPQAHSAVPHGTIVKQLLVKVTIFF